MRPVLYRFLFLHLSMLTFTGQLHTSLSWSEVGSDKCPWQCVCMSGQAHCDSQSLKHMPRPLTPGLEALHIRNNLIRKIHHGHFGHLRSLKHLNLKGNRLSHIAEDTFRNQYNLLSLSLTENNLRQVAPDTFKALGHLRFFSLRKNKLRNVEGLFSRLYSLQLLNIAKNRITKISHRTFRNNWQLMVLDMHSNKISYVHKHAFRSMPLIKYLVLRDNPLKTIDLNFKPNIHLELLDFTNCQLSEVVKGLPLSINDLRLSENRITYIKKKDFKNTRKIRLLVLTNNQISSIDDCVFSRMFRLYDLYLGKNRITRLPNKLPRSIHGLFLNSNNLSRINSEALINIHGLEYLNVRDNNIDIIHQNTFWSLGNLRSLDLSGNGISDLKSHTFQGNKHLQKLDLSSNPLLKLDHDSFAGLENLHIFEMSSVGSRLDDPRIHPVIFKHMKKLLYLDLSNSSQVVRGMKEHPYSLDYINSVEDLNLMEDNLNGLPAQFPNYFPHLHMIKLVGNPWHCDYDILWLAYWMRNRTVEFFAPDHMICVSPPELKGVLIPELTASDVLPVTKKKPIIEFIEISMKEHAGDYNVYITRNPVVTPRPDDRNQAVTVREPLYRTTLTRRFSFVTPKSKTAGKSKGSRNNNTLKYKSKNRDKENRRQDRKNRHRGKYDITPPHYTYLKERYIDPESYKTLAPSYLDLYRTSKQTKPPRRHIFKEVRKHRKHKSHRSKKLDKSIKYETFDKSQNIRSHNLEKSRSKWDNNNLIGTRYDEMSEARYDDMSGTLYEDMSGTSSEETSGTNFETSETRDKTSGRHYETSGTRDETSGTRDETSGTRDGTSGTHFETSGTRDEMSGTRYETSGIRDETSEIRSEESGYSSSGEKGVLLNTRA